MSITDVNCLLGHWPFRKLYKNTFAGLTAVHKENRIKYGCVSSLNSIFYNDPFEGEQELHEIIKDTEYRHIMTVNPMLPAFEEDIERGLQLFKISGVRIYPGFHGYSLDCGQAASLCSILKKHRLPLFLTLRLEDERISYLFKPDTVNTEEIRTFVQANTDLKILLLNIRFAEIMKLKESIINSPNVYFDTSGLKDQLFNIEKLVESLGDIKIMYGSLYPLFCLKSTLLQVTRADISEADREKILSGNFEAFMKTH